MKKLALSAVLAGALALSPLAAKEVKIGVILPMTGAVAAYGQLANQGITLAHQLSPKLKNGDDIKLVVVDTKGDKVETATAATRLITTDGVTALIGEMITANTQQVLQIADEKKTPMIAPAATADKLLDRAKYGARVTFMDSFQGTSFAQYAIKQGHKTAVLVIDQSTSYSLGLARAFKKEFEKQGGKVLSELKISSGDKDFKAVASQIGSAKPAIVYAPLYHPEAALLIRQSRQIGITAPFASGDGVSNDTFIELSGGSAEGYLYTDAFDATNPPTDLSKKFVESAKGMNVSGFTALGADAYFLMLDAMNRCEDSTDKECINKQIKSTKDFAGVSGVINIDAKGNAVRSIVVKEIKDSKAAYKDIINP